MKFKNTWTGNWENAFRGLRHPMESYDRSDSYMDVDKLSTNLYQDFIIGPNDMDLAQRMIKAGSPNDKFLRNIFVDVNITAPVFFIQELDTYKVGTVRNSTSLQHTGMKCDYTLEDFNTDICKEDLPIWNDLIDYINYLRKMYVKTKDYSFFLRMRKLMPMGYEYTFEWSANYAVLRNIIKWRQNHQLPEWHVFIDWCKTLPYAEELLFYKNRKGENA